VANAIGPWTEAAFLRAGIEEFEMPKWPSHSRWSTPVAYVALFLFFLTYDGYMGETYWEVWGVVALIVVGFYAALRSAILGGWRSFLINLPTIMFFGLLVLVVLANLVTHYVLSVLFMYLW